LWGWLADYPDPDSLLRVVFHSTEGVRPGHWHHARFDALVEKAGRIAEQPRRMELYQEADRILAVDEAAVMPLGYGRGRILVKPWVEVPRVPPVMMRLKDVVVKRPNG
jgi:ABC-type oligopeptide transport system substrate-binding subunit